MEDLENWASNSLWDEEESKNLYCYPLKISLVANFFLRKKSKEIAQGIPQNELYRLGPFLCAQSPQTHTGPFRWAIDFVVPDGTPILATYSGKIIELQESSEVWGDGPEYRDALNYLTLMHENGEYSQYCHLGKHSVSTQGLQIGSRVKVGQQIAVVGKSGWTDRDHLHFVIFRNAQNESPFTFKSLKVRFD